ncbi:MAG: YkgJ family cysteine cluster protein [Gemmataceae bacterium]
MSEPWYENGLRFTCTRCGNCCTGAPGYVWVEPGEIAALAETVGMPEKEFTAVYTRKEGKRRSLREKANGDCVFFEHGRGCTVYEARPTQCRTWPFWESTTDTPEDWKQTQEGCPGAGKGQLYTAEEITRRVRALRV